MSIKENHRFIRTQQLLKLPDDQRIQTEFEWAVKEFNLTTTLTLVDKLWCGGFFNPLNNVISIQQNLFIGFHGIMYLLYHEIGHAIQWKLGIFTESFNNYAKRFEDFHLLEQGADSFSLGIIKDRFGIEKDNHYVGVRSLTAWRKAFAIYKHCSKYVYYKLIGKDTIIVKMPTTFNHDIITQIVNKHIVDTNLDVTEIVVCNMTEVQDIRLFTRHSKFPLFEVDKKGKVHLTSRSRVV